MAFLLSNLIIFASAHRGQNVSRRVVRNKRNAIKLSGSHRLLVNPVENSTGRDNERNITGFEETLRRKKSVNFRLVGKRLERCHLLATVTFAEMIDDTIATLAQCCQCNVKNEANHLGYARFLKFGSDIVGRFRFIRTDVVDEANSFDLVEERIIHGANDVRGNFLRGSSFDVGNVIGIWQRCDNSGWVGGRGVGCGCIEDRDGVSFVVGWGRRVPNTKSRFWWKKNLKRK